jgi:hypothetical protein
VDSTDRQQQVVLKPQTLKSWFDQLPPDRQKVLAGDSWLLAEAAFRAGIEAAQSRRDDIMRRL